MKSSLVHNPLLILGFLYFIISMLFTSCLCTLLNPNCDLNRYSIIVKNTWRKCYGHIRPLCNNTTAFCQVEACDLTYDDWEDMKPEKNCNVSNRSISRICKMLFSDVCYEESNNATVQRFNDCTLQIMALASVILYLLR